MTVAAWVLLGAAVCFGQPCADPANIYSFTFGGKSYEVVKEKKTWALASACAVERGGYLAEINSLDEQLAVYDAIVNGAGVPANYVSVPDGGGVAYVWIGATDQAAEGTWLWDGNGDGAGINFWEGQGTAGAGNGHAVGSNYFNWGGTSTGTPKEPDDYAANQDGAAIGLAGWPSGSGSLGIAGEWNDIRLTNQLYFVIEKDGPTGMTDPPAGNSLRIFPNPVRDQLTIESDAAIHTVKVTDLSGALMKTIEPAGKTSFALSVAGLRPGSYIVILRLGDGTLISRKVTVIPA